MVDRRKFQFIGVGLRGVRLVVHTSILLRLVALWHEKPLLPARAREVFLYKNITTWYIKKSQNKHEKILNDETKIY